MSFLWHDCMQDGTFLEEQQQATSYALRVQMEELGRQPRTHQLILANPRRGPAASVVSASSLSAYYRALHFP
eukprot:3798087-Amphidinium_carterae.1